MGNKQIENILLQIQFLTLGVLFQNCKDKKETIDVLEKN